MLANNKTITQVNQDLQLFLGDNTDTFTTWLQTVVDNPSLLQKKRGGESDGGGEGKGGGDGGGGGGGGRRESKGEEGKGSGGEGQGRGGEEGQVEEEVRRRSGGREEKRGPGRVRLRIRAAEEDKEKLGGKDGDLGGAQSNEGMFMLLLIG